MLLKAPSDAITHAVVDGVQYPVLNGLVDVPASVAQTLLRNGYEHGYADSVTRVARSKMTMATIGDSIMAHNVYEAGTTVRGYTDQGVESWASAILGGNNAGLLSLTNFAVGGKLMREIIDEQLGQAIAERPGFIAVGGGTNDVVNETAGGIIAAQRIEAIRAIDAAGIIPVWSTMYARYHSTTARYQQHLACNNMLREFHRDTGIGVFFDGFRYTVDYTSASPTGIASMFFDTNPLHPNNNGGYVLGKVLAQKMANVIPSDTILLNGAQDLTYSPNENLIRNPYFSGTTGSKSGGMTGTLPTDWTGTTGGGATAVASIVTRNDPATGLPIANAIKLVCTFSASGDTVQVYQTGNSIFASQIKAGATISSRMMVEVDAGHTNLSAIDVDSWANPGSGNEHTWWGYETDTRVALPGDALRFMAHTNPIKLSGTAYASARACHTYIRASGAGSATVYLWAPTFTQR